MYITSTTNNNTKQEGQALFKDTKQEGQALFKDNKQEGQALFIDNVKFNGNKGCLQQK